MEAKLARSGRRRQPGGMLLRAAPLRPGIDRPSRAKVSASGHHSGDDLSPDIEGAELAEAVAESEVDG